ncbi:MAG TPA: hypothetical protein VHD60_03025 [Candidatus Saccharimonadales bacterium]|nr:hypothetical protein [Candidatus Saccharimonadales bacterium]
MKKLMPKLRTNQEGFIPLLIAVLLVVTAVIYLAYTRVLHAQH